MIFSKQSIKNIEAGIKTGTTRVSEYWAGVKGPIAIQPPKAPGEPGRGKKGVGYIRIKSVEKVKCPFPHLAELVLLSHASKYHKQEGFRSFLDLHDRFQELKLDKALVKNGVLYYYKFEYLGKEKPK